MRCFQFLIFGLTWAMLTSAGATAQNVTMLDGRVIPFNQVPAVARFSRPLWERILSQGQGFAFALYMSPALCPSALGYYTKIDRTDPLNSSEAARAEAICNRSVRESLISYAADIRDRCKCVLVIEGPTQSRLKAVSAVVEDREFYSNATLFVTQGATRDRLRGIFAHDKEHGLFRILNEKQQPTCNGTGLAAGGQA